jgi:DNA-binding CsgD family transcriptional regulator
MPTGTASATTVRGRARSALVGLARAELDNDSFMCEAAAILRLAVGFDWWCWPLADPGARLPTRHAGVDAPVDRDLRRLAWLLPDSWGAGGRERPLGARPPAARALSAATGGDLRRDLIWREMLGPAGTGDVLDVVLSTDGVCWGQLHLGRDSSARSFGDDDTAFLAGVAPMFAARLRNGLRAGYVHEGPGAEPGTIIVDQDLSLVAATDQAWRWIGRLGMRPPSDAEPLPGFIYTTAARVAASAARAPRSARVRLQAADGNWVVVRVAPLIHGPKAAIGYAITLEAARSEDLSPLLMRAWALTPREREVAGLVIDGLSAGDIAAALFISVHTARDHVKTIFSKVGVGRRNDLVAVLAGQAPSRKP